MDDINKNIGIKKLNKLTPRRRVILGKLPVHWLLKKFHVFYGTRRFITLFTRAPTLVLILSQLKSVQPLQHLSKGLFNIVFLSMPTTTVPASSLRHSLSAPTAYMHFSPSP